MKVIMRQQVVAIRLLGLLIALSDLNSASSAPPAQQPDRFDIHMPMILLTASTERVSVASDGIQAIGGSANPVISADGRFVAFISAATNLVSGDTNGKTDAFVHDRQTGETTRVSVASDGAQGDKDTGDAFEPPAISADGRHIAFMSKATNLVDGDTNELPDIFVHDRGTGTTTRVSVSSNGGQGDGYVGAPTMSTDGRFVAFVSTANNLVENDDNEVADIFIHDRVASATTLASVAESGAQGNGNSGRSTLSVDGRYIAFTSNATNLTSDGDEGQGGLFVRDQETGEVVRIARLAGDRPIVRFSAAPAISANGRYVAYYSDAADPVNGGGNDEWRVFVYDRISGTTTQVGVATDSSKIPIIEYRHLLLSISADGRYLAYESNVDDIVPDDTNEDWDVFVHDREMGRTTRVSVATNGAQGDGHSASGSISADGRHVAFGSRAPNLVNNDTNMATDIFVRDRGEQR